MSEIKPVYQVQQLGEWIEVDKGIFDEVYIQNKFQHRILYPAAAYEAKCNEVEQLQKENAELKSEDEISAAVIEKCCNLLAQIAVTLKGDPEELTRHGYHDLPKLVSVLHVENELNKQSISKFEQILEGVPEGAFDGGWTARGIMKHASDLEKANAAQAKRIADLTEDNLKQKDLILNFQTQYAKDHTEIESLRKQVEEHKEWHMIRDEMRKALEMQMNGGSK